VRALAEPAWSKRLRSRAAEPVLWHAIPAHLALLRSLRPGAPYALQYWLWCRRALRLAGLADPLHGPYESFPHSVRTRELEELMAPIELAGWALDGGVIDLIWTLLKRDEPGMIVEFGSGASTLVFSRFASLMRQAGKNCAVLSIEESEEYKEQTNGWLRRSGLETVTTIVHAPLDAERNYDRATLVRAFDSLPRPADFVLVDGPKGPRVDTLLSLVPYACDGARWVSDDAFRDWGIATLRRWSSTRAIAVHGIYPISKGLATGFIRKDSMALRDVSPAPAHGRASR
jgi:predicted O-methyltransferase YrrM